MDTITSEPNTGEDHPHSTPLSDEDALILRWHPVTDTSRLNSVQRYRRLRDAHKRTEIHAQTDRAMVHRWIHTTLMLLDVQLNDWRVKLIRAEVKHNAPARRRATETTSRSGTVRNSHRVFSTPEILEHIIRYLSPDSLLNARKVNVLFHGVVRITLKHDKWQRTRFESAIEYGDILENPPSLPPGVQDEIEALEEDVGFYSTVPWRGIFRFPIHLPGAISQARDLPSSILDYHKLITSEYSARIHAIPLPTPAGSYDMTPRWLDFTQFEFNPFFEHAFGGRLKLNGGRYEILLQPDKNPYWKLFSRGCLLDTEVRGLIGSMQVTTPPCRTIGIYEPLETVPLSERRHIELRAPPWNISHVRFLRRLHNPTGITVKDLTDALWPLADRITDNWMQAVSKIRSNIQYLCSYPDFDCVQLWGLTREYRDMQFRVGTSPKLMLFLDNHGMASWADGRGHPSRPAYLVDARAKYAGNRMEWEKLLDTMKEHGLMGRDAVLEQVVPQNFRDILFGDTNTYPNREGTILQHLWGSG